MKTFKIKTLEYEKWERHYIVKAKDKEGAIKKLMDGDFEDCPYGETYDTKTNIRDVEVLE